jgi:hypothetical protein
LRRLWLEQRGRLLRRGHDGTLLKIGGTGHGAAVPGSTPSVANAVPVNR